MALSTTLESEAETTRPHFRALPTGAGLGPEPFGGAEEPGGARVVASGCLLNAEGADQMELGHAVVDAVGDLKCLGEVGGGYRDLR